MTSTSPLKYEEESQHQERMLIWHKEISHTELTFLEIDLKGQFSTSGVPCDKLVVKVTV